MYMHWSFATPLIADRNATSNPRGYFCRTPCTRSLPDRHWRRECAFGNHPVDRRALEPAEAANLGQPQQLRHVRMVGCARCELLGIGQHVAPRGKGVPTPSVDCEPQAFALDCVWSGVERLPAWRTETARVDRNPRPSGVTAPGGFLLWKIAP